MRSSDFENAETLEAGSLPVQAAAASSVGSRAAARVRAALVEGSGSQLSSEMRDVLRVRLRASAILFFIAFSAFLVRGFFVVDVEEPSWLFWIHVAVTGVMGAMCLFLTWGGELSFGRLRLSELVVFGDPALFFLIVTQQKLTHTANLSEGAYLPIIVVPWLILIFTYALFIPNSWRRALGVIGPLGAAPLAVLFLQLQTCTGFQHCLMRQAKSSYVTEQVLVMAIGVLIATVGVYTINALRLQAFEAKQLGQYRLKQKLGAGGMGEVYLAEHQMMKRPCAVKVIRPEKAGDPRTLARFEREVRSTAKLSHWNSIDIYDYGRTDDGTFYYVMEYLPGHNVGELVEQYGPLPPERVVYLIDQVGKALAEAHAMGLVHRDIKPANIFCAYRGGECDVAKLLDFGLAKPIVNTSDASLTQEGAITGSPLFMSPEQATGEHEADARSDIYSLGCVVYYLLTGQTPFTHSQPVKVIIAHASETPSGPRDLDPTIPRELEEIVMRCLEKDPDDRFQDVVSLRAALEDIEFDEPWSPMRAIDWWSCHGCDQRKAMAAAAIEAAAAGASCPWPTPSPHAKAESVLAKMGE